MFHHRVPRRVVHLEDTGATADFLAWVLRYFPVPQCELETAGSPSLFPVRLQTTTLISRCPLVETPCRSHRGRNLCAQKFIVVQARSSLLSSGGSPQACKRIGRFEFSAIQCEAILYGPSMDVHSNDLCSFMTMQIADGV